jgi:iron complex outermembrane receptor protein
MSTATRARKSTGSSIGYRGQHALAAISGDAGGDLIHPEPCRPIHPPRQRGSLKGVLRWPAAAFASIGMAASPAVMAESAGEVVDPLIVTAEDDDDRVGPPHVGIDGTLLIERQPRTVAEALRGLPGVSAKTNSRGETIARVRGAEERQTQVFLDGAPLGVPWDGRVDLGVLPAGLIGDVHVVKGAVPIEYGTNAVAGVVDLMTSRRGSPGIEAMVQGGTLGFGAASFVAAADAGPVDLLFAASGVTRDAEPVADLEMLPFSQARSGRRTNTDLDSLSLFGAIGYEAGGFAARASLLRVSTKRGIAPESDRDPAAASPRYWRYPDIDTTQLTVGSNIELGAATALKLIGWRQWFQQGIDQYSNATYSVRRTRQDDDDDMLGGRATLATGFDTIDLRFSANAQTARHVQVDTNVTTGVAGPRLIYRQNLYTLGTEADVPLGPVDATLGLAYDRAAMPLTGDKPPQPDMDALAFSLALRAELSSELTLTLSGGRRTRFPSARELFGEALGRFLINPDLKPETAWLADAELAWLRPGISVTFNPFYSRGKDTIGQRVVRVNGASLRQRYNLSGTQTYGVDAQASVAIGPEFDLEAFGTLLSARADPGDAAFRRLPQRPAYEVGAAIRYHPGDAILLRAEYRRVGGAVDLDANGARAVLAPGDEINLRGSARVAKVAGGALSLTAAVDNLTDDVITPQLGLPLPGRSIRIGIRID